MFPRAGDAPSPKFSSARRAALVLQLAEKTYLQNRHSSHPARRIALRDRTVIFLRQPYFTKQWRSLNLLLKNAISTLKSRKLIQCTVPMAARAQGSAL